MTDGIFSTEDLDFKLDKEKSMIDKRDINDLFVVNNTTHNLIVLEKIKQERQRLKKEVERVLSEVFKKHPFGCNHNCVPEIEKELRKRLGI